MRVQPRSRRQEIVGWRDGVLLIRVTAPPLEGRANAAVCRLLADELGVARSAVTLAAGARGRDKRLRVQGVSSARLRSLAP